MTTAVLPYFIVALSLLLSDKLELGWYNHCVSRKLEALHLKSVETGQQARSIWGNCFVSVLKSKSLGVRLVWGNCRWQMGQNSSFDQGAGFRWVVPSCSNRVESAAWSRRELVLIALMAYSRKRTERVFRVTVGHEGGVPSVKLR